MHAGVTDLPEGAEPRAVMAHMKENGAYTQEKRKRQAGTLLQPWTSSHPALSPKLRRPHHNDNFSTQDKRFPGESYTSSSL